MKDQTDPSVAATAMVAERGTAIYLVEQPNGTKRKILRPLGSYAAFLERGVDPTIVAGKWVPDRVSTLVSLQASLCKGVKCVDSCVNPGCICDPMSQTCV